MRQALELAGKPGKMAHGVKQTLEQVQSVTHDAAKQAILGQVSSQANKIAT